jgi:hypothetical protein
MPFLGEKEQYSDYSTARVIPYKGHFRVKKEDMGLDYTYY